MASVFLRSTNGQTITYANGLSIGPVPLLVDSSNADYASAVADTNIEIMTNTAEAKQLIRISQVTMLSQLELNGQAVSDANPLPSKLSGSIPAGTSTLGQAKIATGGTAVELTLPANCRYVEVKAGRLNTDTIMVGTSGAVAVTDDGTGNAFELGAGDSEIFEVTGGQLWINSASLNQYVTYKAVV